MTTPRSARRAAPLHGIRVVDLTTVVLGPYASQLLGEYGADVIKVEAPGGDSTRQIGPAAEEGMAALFLGVNRNKRSIVLDLKSQAGTAALLELVASADVFMHNMRPAKLEALGIGAAELRAVNPRLVFAALLGFASGGPYEGRPAYDDVIQGLSGMAALMQAQTGTARYLPTTIADKVGSLFAVQAIMAALFEREKTGAGVCLEVPMFEALVSFGLVEHMQGAHFEPPLGSVGYERALMPFRRPFPTLDGHLCVMPYSDAHWRALLREAGDEAALADPRFAGMASRTRHIGELYERLSRHIASRCTDEWLAVCRRCDVPAERMNQLPDLLVDPQLQAGDHFARVLDARMGTLVFPTNPIRFDGWRAEPTMPPRLGEDTSAVLEHIGSGGSRDAGGAWRIAKR
ncbi:CaiB/BaiF CoA transferase family protein [Piscinibacter koreensis]|uniref:CoA transferase n=1 Tax=Piscinibacter koreensis TaxID=2742824 RepID=A0A7Y6NRG4_9BURK|nr:CoA transferase [Schlegelella koreensis]NUZ07950.1 CoA transferase [Schlegelella koreensis]